MADALDGDIFDPQVSQDPYPLYAALRDRAPVHLVRGTGFHLVSTAAVGAEAVARPDDFSSNLTAVVVRGALGPTVVGMASTDSTHVLATADDPEHAEHRSLVLARLVAKRVNAIEPAVSALAERLWDEAAPSGRIDWVADMADRLPMTVVARVIGLPDADVGDLLRWSYDATEMLGGMVSEEDFPRLVESAVRLTGYMYSAMRRAEDDPGDDLLGDLVRACESGRITVDTAVLMLVQLVGAGGESTSALISSSARLLAEHRPVQDALRADPSLVAPFLDEVLRFESPFRGHHRHVLRDTSLGGVDLAAGSHLILLWGSANRDATVFDAPDELRLDRPNPKAHLAFGRGVHFCVGAVLARMEARTALRVLLERSREVGVVDARWVPSLLVRRHATLTLSL